LNLLLNAIAAAEPGTDGEAALELTVARSQGLLAMVVGNTGPSLPAERLAQMFEPFVAAGASTGSHRHGLGLWVCWQIVQRLGGTIDVASDGEWTRVSVTLPVADSMSGG
jgi:signal transduction histidine kinase